MNTLPFTGLIDEITLMNLISKYKIENIDSNFKLIGICICINGIKFESSVKKLNWDYEMGDYYIYKYNIRRITINNIKIDFIITPSVPINLIKSYPILEPT